MTTKKTEPITKGELQYIRECIEATQQIKQNIKELGALLYDTECQMINQNYKGNTEDVKYLKAEIDSIKAEISLEKEYYVQSLTN